MRQEKILLPICQAGDPVLRQEARRLSHEEITTSAMQQLIANIKHTVAERDYGVGLAAPQVGQALALSVLAIKPTPNRPDREPFEQVIINPSYTGIGQTTGMWEGCASGDEGRLFAQAQRYQQINAQWNDEWGEHHTAVLDGFVAHVFQHEADHCQGILFFDRVADTTTYMTAAEYRKRIVGR